MRKSKNEWMGIKLIGDMPIFIVMFNDKVILLVILEFSPHVLLRGHFNTDWVVVVHSDRDCTHGGNCKQLNW